MADIKLNFSSQWPSMQVAKVIPNLSTAGESAEYPYSRKIKHGLKYPPFTLLMAGTSYDTTMIAAPVDDTYVYIDQWQLEDTDTVAVVHPIDITQEYDYASYTSDVGDVIEDKSGGSIDMRDFLLHSRAVSPMLLSTKTNTYNKNSLEGLNFSYTHPLNYPTFSFGYLRLTTTVGVYQEGVWIGAPLDNPAWPVLFTDGFTSQLATTIHNGQYQGGEGGPWIPGTGELAADKGSIITLRNPAIITSNTVNVIV